MLREWRKYKSENYDIAKAEWIIIQGSEKLVAKSCKGLWDYETFLMLREWKKSPLTYTTFAKAEWIIIQGSEKLVAKSCKGLICYANGGRTRVRIWGAGL